MSAWFKRSQLSSCARQFHISNVVHNSYIAPLWNFRRPECATLCEYGCVCLLSVGVAVTYHSIPYSSEVCFWCLPSKQPYKVQNDKIITLKQIPHEIITLIWSHQVETLGGRVTFDISVVCFSARSPWFWIVLRSKHEKVETNCGHHRCCVFFSFTSVYRVVGVPVILPSTVNASAVRSISMPF